MSQISDVPTAGRVVVSSSSNITNEKTRNKFVQAVVLSLLVLQTTSSCTLISYSKVVLKQKYNPVEIVMCTEFLKLVASGLLSVFLYRDERDHEFNLRKNFTRVLLLIGKNLNLLVLVVIWAYTNTSSFRAVELVGAPTYSVVMQSKIFFTAGFGVLLMSKKYSFTKWRALVLLVIGCTLVSSSILIPKVEIPSPIPCDALHATTSLVDDSLQHNITSVHSGSSDSKAGASASRKLRGHALITHYASGHISRYLSDKQLSTTLRSNGSNGSPLDALFGLCLTLSIALCSGFTAVYFERILKNGSGGMGALSSSATSIWDRNFQLAFYSILFTASITIYQNVMSDERHLGANGEENVFFAGWSWVTVLICVVNSLGGFLVAATLKYADSILKCFATAVSIILTSIIGYVFLENEISFFSALGMLTTILSVMNYSLEEKV